MKLNSKEIELLYGHIEAAHDEHLSVHGVRMPQLRKGGNFTIEALVLAYLARSMGKPVTKKEITVFVKSFHPAVNDVQQARHLSNGKGWHILSKQRKDIGTENWPRYSYGLMTLKIPHPNWHPRRTGALSQSDWRNIKAENSENGVVCCASCGSKDGHPHRHYPASLVEIQRGHMDPNKDLRADNCIPQCQFCNRPARNWWVFDRFGRPHAIAKGDIILRSSPKIRQDALKALLSENPEMIKELPLSIIKSLYPYLN